jgi:hypothetical protein
MVREARVAEEAEERVGMHRPARESAARALTFNNGRAATASTRFRGAAGIT